MGTEGISKSQVSRLCGEIDERVRTFLSRPIEGEWPYVWLDATYVKARRDHHIVSVAVIVAVGVNTDGRHPDCAGIPLLSTDPSARAGRGRLSCHPAQRRSDRWYRRTGKSHIAIAIGANSVRNGARVRFFTEAAARAGKPG